LAEKGLTLLVDQMADEGTIKKRFAMSELIDYRFINEAQKKSSEFFFVGASLLTTRRESKSQRRPHCH
jgi:hypothetical protein